MQAEQHTLPPPFVSVIHYEQLPQALVAMVSRFKEPHHGTVSPNKPFLPSVFFRDFTITTGHVANTPCQSHSSLQVSLRCNFTMVGELCLVLYSTNIEPHSLWSSVVCFCLSFTRGLWVQCLLCKSALVHFITKSILLFTESPINAHLNVSSFSCVHIF